MTVHALKTRSQELAEYAWQSIQGVACDPNEDFKKKYRSVVRNLGALIQTNGLGLTLSYLLSKSSDPALSKLYDHLAERLKAQVSWNNSAPDLMARLVASSSQTYWHATREALDLALWLRRFAEALLPEE